MRDWVLYTWHFRVSWCRFCGTGPRLETWCHPSSPPPRARAAQTAVAAPEKRKTLPKLFWQTSPECGARREKIIHYTDIMYRILCGLKCDEQLAIIVPGAGVWLWLSSGATCQWVSEPAWDPAMSRPALSDYGQLLPSHGTRNYDNLTC